jgi:hypothetical protein
MEIKTMPHATLASSPAMVEERSEQVYFLAPAATPTFVDVVASHLDEDAYCRSDASGRAHYVTTLYFDSESRAIARACETGAGMRLRAREYYDRLPAAVQREPLLWLEVKTRAGASTRKVRFAIPSDEVPTYLHDGVIDPSTLEQEHARWTGSAELVLHEIGQLCMLASGPLRPDCVAQYRRRAWQDASETLRITLDTELAFHRPPAHPFADGHSLSEALTEPPVARVVDSLVEIKRRGDSPAWLSQLVRELDMRPASEGLHSFSKFVAASRAVHQP